MNKYTSLQAGAAIFHKRWVYFIITQSQNFWNLTSLGPWMPPLVLIGNFALLIPPSQKQTPKSRACTLFQLPQVHTHPTLGHNPAPHLWIPDSPCSTKQWWAFLSLSLGRDEFHVPKGLNSGLDYESLDSNHIFWCCPPPKRTSNVLCILERGSGSKASF